MLLADAARAILCRAMPFAMCRHGGAPLMLYGSRPANTERQR